jgi:aryl-alcohol dehydrogenase-like predicted oxidoreductase
MEFRRLGRSGLKVSEISYGNWLTHGSQVEAEQATACVHEALEVGITTFDTADVYAQTKAETVLGEALKGQRREGLEIFTKVYWPTGPGPERPRAVAQAHPESLHGSLRRLQTDYVDLYQAHRFDDETPLEETLKAFDDLVRQGKVLYVGVSEWKASEIEAALKIADEMGFDRLVSNQPQYSMLWRVIEGEVVPLCAREGVSQIVWSPIAQGVLTGKYLPGRRRPRARAPPTPPARASSRASCATRCWRRCSSSSRWRTRPAVMAALASRGCCRTRTSPARSSGDEPEQVRDNVAAAGRDARPRAAAQGRRRARGRRRQRPRPRPSAPPSGRSRGGCGRRPRRRSGPCRALPERTVRTSRVRLAAHDAAAPGPDAAARRGRASGGGRDADVSQTDAGLLGGGQAHRA